MPPGTAFKATEAVVARVERALLEEPETPYRERLRRRRCAALLPVAQPRAARPGVREADRADAERRGARLAQAAHARAHRGGRVSSRARARHAAPVRPPGPVPGRVPRRRACRPTCVREIAEEVRQIVAANPDTRDAFLDWGERASAYRFVLDQDRLRLLGFTPSDVKLQLNALLSGNPITEVREGIRTIPVLARAVSEQRENLDGLEALTITNAAGVSVPLEQVGRFEPIMEDPDPEAAQPRDHDRGARRHRRRHAAARRRAGRPSHSSPS